MTPFALTFYPSDGNYMTALKINANFPQKCCINVIMVVPNIY